MAAVPYLISGTVRVGPRAGYGEVDHVVNTNEVGAENIDVYVDGGVQLAASVTITLLNVNTGQSVSVSTDANGDYIYDLASLSSGYSNNDVIRFYYNTADATRDVPHNTNDSTASNLPEADGRFTRVIMPGRQGREYTEEYPLPVTVTDFEVNFENPSSVMTYTTGQITTETKTIKGVQYRKTYTWASGNLTNETAWVRL